jgi:hypothetical protein
VRSCGLVHGMSNQAVTASRPRLAISMRPLETACVNGDGLPLPLPLTLNSCIPSLLAPAGQQRRAPSPHPGAAGGEGLAACQAPPARPGHGAPAAGGRAAQVAHHRGQVGSRTDTCRAALAGNAPTLLGYLACRFLIAEQAALGSQQRAEACAGQGPQPGGAAAAAVPHAPAVPHAAVTSTLTQRRSMPGAGVPAT